MKKKIFALLLTVTLGMNLIGCGGDDAAETSETAETTAAEASTEAAGTADTASEEADAVQSGLCSIVVRNGFDFDLAEIYASAADSEEKGDNLIVSLKASDSQELDISPAVGDTSGTINLYVMVNDGDTAVFKSVSVSDGDIMNICYVDKTPVLYLNSVDKVTGEVTLSEAHQEEQNKLAEEATSDLYPNKYDKLTKCVYFDKAPDVKVPYSDKMEAYNVTNINDCISFNAVNRDQNPYVFFSSIMVRLLPISGFDDAMKCGYAEAKKALEYITEQGAKGFYGDKLSNITMTGFIDNGTSWECEAVAVFDKSLWSSYTLDDNVYGYINVKYVGATGYVVYSAIICNETYFDPLAAAAIEMINYTALPEGFSTAAKTLTKESKQSGTRIVIASAGTSTSSSSSSGGKSTSGAKTSGTSAYSGDFGDYGTAYYWTDSDGDIWYWNGYEDEFYAFGDHYSVDTDTGEVMENNDYGWGYDEYNEWSDPGDTWDYADDGNDYEANDYGWGEDDYNEWSDPGDTWDYEDDGNYYEANDYYEADEYEANDYYEADEYEANDYDYSDYSEDYDDYSYDDYSYDDYDDYGDY